MNPQLAEMFLQMNIDNERYTYFLWSIYAMDKDSMAIHERINLKYPYRRDRNDAYNLLSNKAIMRSRK